MSNKNKLNEDAGGAVGAGAVASFAMPLLSQAIKRPVTKVKTKKPKVAKKSYGIGTSLKAVFEAGPEAGMAGMGDISNAAGLGGPSATNPSDEFDQAGVFAKLKAAEKKESVDRRDTTTFGLEDENGKLVRVTVPNDQADKFEQVLQTVVSRQDEDMDNAEIAELLFNLRDQFTFVDVEWPEIEEDEEEQPEQPTDGEMDLSNTDGEGDMDFTLDQPATSDTSTEVDEVKGLLTKVIDMMKSDADARRQEAIAREKEAEVRAADSAVNQALAKVKQEEQILDMEVWNKAQKEETKEAKRLAQLARWKHEMSKQNGSTDDDEQIDDIVSDTVDRHVGSEENEEIVSKSNKQAKATVKPRNKVKPGDIAAYLLKKVK